MISMKGIIHRATLAAKIDLHFPCGAPPGQPIMDLVATEPRDDSEIYLGGGFWRMVPVWDEDSDSDDLDKLLLGIRLVNPDKTPDEIATVERGLCILEHLEYEEG